MKYGSSFLKFTNDTVVPAKARARDLHHLLRDERRRADQRIGPGAGREALAVQPVGSSSCEPEKVCFCLT
jgi:hypothetical protein